MKKRKLEEEKILPILPKNKKDRIVNQHYTYKNKEVIWNGKILNCHHKKRVSICKDCHGTSLCKHKKRKYRCIECVENKICEHNEKRSRCNECLYIKHQEKCKNCLSNDECSSWKILKDYPSLLEYFDVDKNKIPKSKACFLRMGSQKIYFWLCKTVNCENKCLHQWQTSLNNLRNVVDGKTKTGCPFCSTPSKKVCCCNSLYTQRPDIMKNWDYKMNPDIDPKSTSVHSGIKIHWICQDSSCTKRCEHRWIASIDSRTNRKGSGCPYCSNPPKKICKCNSLANLFPNLLQEWDFHRNAVDPKTITSGSHKKVWWVCRKFNCEKKCLHQWLSKISNRTSTNNAGCPFCAIPSRKVCPCNSLMSIHSSLVNKNWNYEKNQDLDPQTLAPYSNKVVWWKCTLVNCEKKCPHPDWTAGIHTITKGHNCPYCAGSKLCKCKTLLGKYPEIVKQYWDFEKNQKLGIDPANIAPNSEEKAWWLCKNVTCKEKCLHAWKVNPGGLVRPDKPSGCPFCCKPAQRFCVCNSLYGKFRQLIEESWDFKKNTIDPKTIGPYSNKNAWWYCNQGHEWENIISHRTERKSRCPKCTYQKSIMEEELSILLEALKDEGKIQWFKGPEDQTTLPGMIFKQSLRLDFLVKFKDLKKEVVIETDGEQHFNWKRHLSFDKWLESLGRDFAKNTFLKKSGRHLLRLSYKVKLVNYAQEVNLFIKETHLTEENSDDVHHKFVDSLSYDKQFLEFYKQSEK